MKVLYFHQHFCTPSGAGGTRSYEFAKKLVKRGHSVTMVCGSYEMGDTGLHGSYVNGQRFGKVDGFSVIELNLPYSNNDGFVKRSYLFMLFAFRSVLVVFREPHDLVFASSTPLTVGIPALASRWILGKPFVFEIRDLWPESPKAMGVITNPVLLCAMSCLEWTCYHSARIVIGLSPGIVAGIVKRGIGEEKTVLIPNGCDRELFDTTISEPIIGIDPSTFNMIYCGAHGRANGLDAILDVAKVLQGRQARACFLFVGEGSEKQRLKSEVTTLALLNCHFIDALPKIELAGLLKRMDLGVMCLQNIPAFYYGTSPNKFFDFISAGLPVINNYPGWIAELVTENSCGIAVPPDDPLALAEAIEHLISNPLQRRKMSESSVELAKRFDRNMLADQFVDTLESTLDNHQIKF